MNFNEKILVTGMGIVSSLGCDLNDVSKALYEGKSNIEFDSFRKEKGFRSALTAKLKNFNTDNYGFSRKQLKSMGEAAIYAGCALKSALNDAEFDISKNSEKTGIIIGNDSTVKDSFDTIKNLEDVKETRLLGSGSIFKCMNSTVSMNLATIFGIKGINISLSAACASGAHAIGYAYQLLSLGLLDVVICGASQELNWEVYAAFDGLGAFSLRENSPLEASRPFDSKRDGLIPSGGAAVIILERESHAKMRSCNKYYGEIAGYGFSSDGGYLSNPTGEGGIRAIKMALSNAKINPSSVDYINAHATSTIEGDKVEASIINEVFGKNVYVSSTKSLTGHECWMAGASEVIYSLLMMRDGFLAANKNFISQEDTAHKINILKESIKYSPKIIMSNSFGFGGTNAVLILKKYF